MMQFVQFKLFTYISLESFSANFLVDIEDFWEYFSTQH